MRLASVARDFFQTQRRCDRQTFVQGVSKQPGLVNAVPLDLSLLFPLLEEINLASTEATELAALVVHQDVSALKEAERLKDEFIAIAAHELRGGRLWFASVEERGTTFFLALPNKGEAAALA